MVTVIIIGVVVVFMFKIKSKCVLCTKKQLKINHFIEDVRGAKLTESNYINMNLKHLRSISTFKLERETLDQEKEKDSSLASGNSI
jgi:hypothetical protein